MPRAWDQAHLENVKVADNEISVYYEVEPTGSTLLKITQTEEDWTVRLILEKARQEELEVIRGTVITQQQGETHVEIVGRGGALEVRYKTH